MPTASQSAFTLRNIEAGASEPLYQVKLLSALRSGDPALIHPFLTEFDKERRKSQDPDADAAASALHLAIRCASTATVALLLSNRSISPNAIHPPGSGTTALHLASSLGRADVVSLLLEQEGIDDTLRDRDGKTCKDVARGRDVMRVIHDSRSFLTASYRSLLRTYIHSSRSDPPPPSLLALLSSPRIRLVDLSYLDDATGTTLLHEAARRRDLRLVELAVRGGADIFVRDRRGRTVSDVVGKDDKVRVFLRQFTNQDTTLIEDATNNEPPTLRGYLNKYTNVARGYSTRWFVLKDGVLSYYRHQEDEQVASRGSISMKTAILRPGNSGEKMRFEVQSTPSRAHSSVQKWYLKANHPVEASRWVLAISRSIEWHKQLGDTASDAGDASSTKASVLGSISSLNPSSIRQYGYNREGRNGDDDSLASSVGDKVDSQQPSPNIPQAGDPQTSDEQDKDEANDESSANDSEDNLQSRVPPYDTSFDLQGNSTAAQLDLTGQILESLCSGNPPAPRAAELRAALKESLSSTRSMMTEYLAMVKERDDWWRKRLKREQERQSMWEESLKSVVEEGEALERELRTHARRHSRSFEPSFASDAGGGTLKARPSKLPLALSPPPMEEMTESPLATAVPATAVPAPSPPIQPGEHPQPSVGALRPQRSRTITPSAAANRRRSLAGAAISPGLSSAGLETEEGDTDEEDEFFDAIETNALPNLVVNEQLVGLTEPSIPPSIKTEQYKGYKVLRRSLGLKSDNRPPTSLWSVLKHSIGKDLTKISFPVFFNEPTSMLQRMAEDMEFSECLDAAAEETDPLRRIAFVAAFAMSNYSSTIGRIAKPFNPMLSETFEYVRLDKEYRYVSEQVSHHPPISACFAESPRWHYYGEVDAQNKFTGKSFEIRPTGVAHADLLLPTERAPHYPKYESEKFKDRVIEHYSWKKVTTNVSGFILGSPTIDHYGDMIVTNHRTGDQCVLTFKPRGWRGKDAFEISGYVQDAQGDVVYEIAGRWNSQLVARAVGVGSGSLNPDVSVSSEPTPEFILLWRNSEKPPAPFNLTPFAITLNDCPEDTLKPYIAPTDCRLRPDQRAFELGHFEHANTLKQKQEEIQRATRKAREEGRLPPHEPRWFRAETDGDTGERVWSPSRVGLDLEYWVEREKVYVSGCKEKWANVEPIFSEDEP
ncbi:hypothetical protein DENSPDRAFT_831423 [Dentipellis sp. KUC8613]|nr:hypothetical protein DENSPDRAFT_831423 [Dentipellis sp. KUC8613]